LEVTSKQGYTAEEVPQADDHIERFKQARAFSSNNNGIHICTLQMLHATQAIIALAALLRVGSLVFETR
jgi:hypothetical protein